MSSHPSFAAVPVLASLIAIGPAFPVEFSQRDWSNPSQAGSAVWIKNPGNKAVRLDSLYVRTLGFQSFREAAFNAGPRRVWFTVAGDPRGHWVRLVPRNVRRLRVRARDSLMITGFECGAGLRAGRGARKPAEEFVLDLKLVDDRGGRAQVKISQMTKTYSIGTPPETDGMDSSGK
jgi:hypothetical protein